MASVNSPWVFLKVIRFLMLSLVTIGFILAAGFCGDSSVKNTNINQHDLLWYTEYSVGLSARLMQNWYTMKLGQQAPCESYNFARLEHLELILLLGYLSDAILLVISSILPAMSGSFLSLMVIEKTRFTPPTNYHGWYPNMFKRISQLWNNIFRKWYWIRTSKCLQCCWHLSFNLFAVIAQIFG